MSKLTKAEVERMVRAYWKQQSVPKGAQKPLASTRALQKLGTAWLRSTGFDLKQAESLRAQQQAEWDQMTPKAAVNASKRWSSHVKQLQAAATAWAGNMTANALGTSPDASFAIAKPISILASDQSILKDSHIEPTNSFAKVLVDRKSSREDTISFIFGFRNGAANTFLFNFDTLINVSAHVRVRAGAGFVNSGVVTVDAKLDVLTATQVTDTQNIATVAVLSDGPPFFGGESNERTFAFTRFLTASGVVLEADDIVVLLVSLVVRSDLDDAHVVADFNSGNFRALCPAVFVSRQPLPMKASGDIVGIVSG